MLLADDVAGDVAAAGDMVPHHRVHAGNAPSSHARSPRPAHLPPAPVHTHTQSKTLKNVIKGYLEDTGDVAGLAFKLHDFGARGVSSMESAALGGAAHLVNFMGTDTVSGVLLARECYGAEMAGFSIPAAEHSTITSWGKVRMRMRMETEGVRLRSPLNGISSLPVVCVSFVCVVCSRMRWRRTATW